MDNSYIFPLEANLKSTLRQFNRALNADRKNYELYRNSKTRKLDTVERWDNKLTAYMDAFNELEFLINRAVMIDHERSTYVHQIKKLKDNNKRLEKYLNILSVTKRIEIEEQVKFKVEQQVNLLCKKASDELQKEINLHKGACITKAVAAEGRVA